MTDSFTATIHRPGPKNEYGTRIGEVEIPLPGCLLYPRLASGRSTSTEDDYQKTQVSTGLSLIVQGNHGGASLTVDVRPEDVIELPAHPLVPVAYHGTRWEVLGEMAPWASPFTTWRPGVEIAIERVTG